MKIRIVEQSELNQNQVTFIKKRLSLKEHRYDQGPCRCWEIYQYGMYAAVGENETDIIALLEVSGPKGAVEPGWWVDIQYRGQGYGELIVKAFSSHFRRKGCYGIGNIRVFTTKGQYDEASEKLKQLFISEFIKK
jgi:RimJ/RimL family protein N-acetyltransferase